MEENEVDVEGHAKGPEAIDTKEHLDQKALNLAERRELSTTGPIFGYHSRCCHTQVANGSVEDLAIDGLLEVRRQRVGCEYKSNPHK